MGEAWDDLAAFRARRGECAGEVAKIKARCAQDHSQHKHVLECRECYPRTINCMRSWFLDTKNQEWFSGREVFLGELKALFAAALDHAVGLEEIDARIDTERRKWYQEQIKASPSIRKSLEELTDHKDVLAKVGTGAPFEDLLESMQAALDGASSREDAKKSLDRLIVARSPEEKYQLYKETFFHVSPDEHISEKTQLYADRLQTGATMDEIVNKISLDRRSSIGASDQKERNRKRIDELRRARAAHELQKSKKASGRKDTQKPQPPSEVYDQPPCSACRRDVDTRSFYPCHACVVMLDAGIRSRTTVYCSPACRDSDRGEVSSRNSYCMLSLDPLIDTAPCTASPGFPLWFSKSPFKTLALRDRLMYVSGHVRSLLMGVRNSTWKKVTDVQAAITAHKSQTRTSIWTWKASNYSCAGNAPISTRSSPFSAPCDAQTPTSGAIEKRSIYQAGREDRSRSTGTSTTSSLTGRTGRGTMRGISSRTWCR